MAKELAGRGDGHGSPNGATPRWQHGCQRPHPRHALGGGHRSLLGHRTARDMAMHRVRCRSSSRCQRSPADRITGATCVPADRDTRTALRHLARTLAGGERNQRHERYGSSLHRGHAPRSLGRARRPRRVPPTRRQMRDRSRYPWISEPSDGDRGPVRVPAPGVRARPHETGCSRHHGPHGLPRGRTGSRGVFEFALSPIAAQAHLSTLRRGDERIPGRPARPILQALCFSVHPNAASQDDRGRDPHARRETGRHHAVTRAVKAS